MRARIATIAVLLSLAGLGIGPALADDCPVTDQLLEQCPPPAPQPQPDPQPQPEPQPAAQPSVPPGPQPAAVARLLVLLNQDRARNHLSAFTLREDVSVQSRHHSETMAAAGTIWHNDAFFTVANRALLDARILGENVARNVDIDDAHRRLMASPHHRANILDGRFRAIGLGVYRSSTGSLYVTENFVQPAVHAAPKPAARREVSRSMAAPAPATTTTTVPEPVVAPEPEPVVLAAGPAAALAPMPLDQGDGHRIVPFLAFVLLAAVLVGAAVFTPLASRIRR